jgi:hypothetical protein
MKQPQIFVRCSKCKKLTAEEFCSLYPSVCAVCSSIEPKKSELLKRSDHIYAAESLRPSN